MISRLLLPAVFLVLSATDIRAQELAWERVASSSPAASALPVRVMAAPDGGVVAVVAELDAQLPQTGVPDARVDVVVSRFDTDGALQWRRTFPGSTRAAASTPGMQGKAFDAEIDASGEIVLLVPTMTASASGPQAQLLRLAPDGSTLWTLDLHPSAPVDELRACAVALSPGGGVVVLTTELAGTSPYVDVRSVDRTGNVLWRWGGASSAPAGGGARGDGVGVVVSSTGVVFAFGCSDLPINFAAASLWTLSISGQWTRRSNLSMSVGPYTMVDAALRSNGGVAAAVNVVDPNFAFADAFFARYDASGLLDHWHVLPGSDPASAIVASDDDHLYVAASYHDRMAVQWVPPGTAFNGVIVASGPTAFGVRTTGVVLREDRLVAIGTSPSGSDSVRLVSFDWPWTDRWISSLPGGVGPRQKAELTMDGQENLYVLTQRPEGPSTQLAHVTRILDVTFVGTPYCGPAVPNSTGVGGKLTGVGSDVAADNDLVLRAFDLPTQTFGYALVSQNQAFIPNPGGSAGNLCLRVGLGRYVDQVRSSATTGVISTTVDLTAVPQPTGSVAALAGETWNFQLWHRDSSPSGPSSNFTEGLSITLR